VLHVLFARPQHFNGTAIQRLCDSNRLFQFAMRAAAAKAAALEAIVDEDLRDRQTGNLGSNIRRVIGELCAQPDLGAVAGHLRRAIGGLELRVRLMRQFILRIDDLDGLAERHLDIAFVDSRRTFRRDLRAI
jgi:hypothetical protein